MEKEISPYPLLLVGAGRMGLSWIQAVLNAKFQSREIVISGICDPDPASSRAGLLLKDVKVMAKLEDAIEEAQPLGAIIASPPYTHEVITEILVSKGIPVLCDKPFAFSAERAEKIFRVSREKRVPVLMASKYRFVKDLQRAAEIVSSGVIGYPVHSRIRFASYFPVEGTWRVEPDKSGGGVLADSERNTLLQLMNDFRRRLRTGGHIAFSGIMAQDRPLLHAAARSAGFVITSEQDEAEWHAFTAVKTEDT